MYNKNKDKRIEGVYFGFAFILEIITSEHVIN